jgi:hypothetical protein
MRFAASAVMVAGLAWGSEDSPRRHAEAIGAGRHEFQVRMNGDVDAVNTRDPIVYEAWKQGFQPMRVVRLENTGETPIVNPWVIVNGQRNWRTAKDIADSALRAFGDPAAMTDADKARAIWEFQRRHRFHATPGDLEVRDPVKMFNVYGYSLCGDNAPVLSDLWRLAGLKTRRGFAMGHCVSEVWYDGAWHMLDADESILFLERDNRTVASEKTVARDHDLARRSYESDVLPGLYPYDHGHSGDYPSHANHSMAMTLRPGEAIEWRWAHEGKHHHSPAPSIYSLERTELSRWGENAWATLCNGKWAYAPNLRTPAGRAGAGTEGVVWGSRAKDAAASARPGSAAALTWKLSAPYVIVGGKVTAKVRTGRRGAVVLSVSRGAQQWVELARVERAGTTVLSESLDAQFPNEGAPLYGYWLRAELQSAAGDSPAGLDSIVIENDLQMAPLSLPSLELGENRITYTDDTQGARSARLTFDWVERTGTKAPRAPASPVFPADGAEVEGTRFNLRWQNGEATAGEKIAAYHFQLSGEPEFRWALSPAFDTVTPAANPQFTILSDGLLNPGTRYWWRVRSKSEAGVWGEWSRAWSFVPQAPGTPMNVRLEQTDPELFTLRWDAGEGRKPAAYKVYASNEEGFTASDAPYVAHVGNQKQRGLFPGETRKTFPPNLLKETAEPALKLKPQHAFYRVVALDGKGSRSGASNLVAAPRPFIYSEPPAEAKAGVPFKYEVKTIASIGDLTFRDFGPGQSYQSAYWEADQPRYSIEFEMPRCGNFDAKWLTIDPKTGILTGTPGPEDATEHLINVRVEIPGAGVYIQSFPLRVTK